MIPIHELRLGNTVKCTVGNDAGWYRVAALQWKNLMAMLDGAREGTWYPEKALRPIPLSIEIFEQYGFQMELNVIGDPYEGYFFTKRLSDHKYCDLALMSGDKTGKVDAFLFPYDMIRFRYLHELENAYFFMTGKELRHEESTEQQPTPSPLLETK